jgi:ATP-dependent Clp protease, protease subunit
MFLPTIIEESGGVEKRYDPISRLAKDRILCLYGEVSDEMSLIVCSTLLFFEKENPEQEIWLYINSPGGSVMAGSAIYDVMQTITADINTVGMGHCCSMGSFLLAAGTKGKRFALPSTRIMIHEVSSGMGRSTATDMQIQMDETMHLRQDLNAKLAYHTGKTPDQIKKDTNRDNWMGVKEAIKYGLIDDTIKYTKIDVEF